MKKSTKNTFPGKKHHHEKRAAPDAANVDMSI